MSRKLIIVTDSNNEYLKLYLKNQIDAIKKHKPELEVSLEDETSELLSMYVTEHKRSRIPVFFYFKNGRLAKALFGRNDTHKVLSWIDGLGF